MYIKIQNKKLEITECTTFISRHKTFKFYLKPIDFGLKLPHKKKWSTYYFCQNVDICVTNKENQIINLYENVSSERKKIIWKAYNIYYLPLNTCKYLTLGETIKEKEK